MLRRLREIGFQEDGNFVWTHHNYEDIEYDVEVDTSAEFVLSYLEGHGWRGWADRAVNCDAQLMLTEGGCRLDGVPNNDEFDQWYKMLNNYERMRALPGVAMQTNYVLYSSPTFNSGLLDPVDEGWAPGRSPRAGFNGTPRTIIDPYWSTTWRTLPSFADGE